VLVELLVLVVQHLTVLLEGLVVKVYLVDLPDFLLSLITQLYTDFMQELD
jgi:hypothetical protein